MPLAPWYVGQTYRPLSFVWTKDDAARTPNPIAGRTLELWFRSPRRRFKGTGTFVVTDDPGGKMAYTLSQADVAIADDYEGQVKAYPAGQPLNAEYSDRFSFPLRVPIDKE